MKIPEGKIKWASRRGMRELDLMLLPFVEHDIKDLSEQELEDYMDLLNATDLQLVRWFNGVEQADSEKRRRMVALIVQKHSQRIGREGV
ncbi:MAG: succinate dehydrogenase assembly factor 2 [Succinivibrio sp.]|nr:succinate dehydrogenase assembly factor 2 [Succinivibrio sp.]